jgi:hypothetical protein
MDTEIHIYRIHTDKYAHKHTYNTHMDMKLHIQDTHRQTHTHTHYTHTYYTHTYYTLGHTWTRKYTFTGYTQTNMHTHTHL